MGSLTRDRRGSGGCDFEYGRVVVGGDGAHERLACFQPVQVSVYQRGKSAAEGVRRSSVLERTRKVSGEVELDVDGGVVGGVWQQIRGSPQSAGHETDAKTTVKTERRRDGQTTRPCGEDNRQEGIQRDAKNITVRSWPARVWSGLVRSAEFWATSAAGHQLQVAVHDSPRHS